MKQDTNNVVPEANEVEKQEVENNADQNIIKPSSKKHLRQRRIGSYFRMALRNTHQED
jgi:hypothetical protein